MKAQYPSSSGGKNTTLQEQEALAVPNRSRPLMAIAAIGAALITYQVHKTPDARQRLECLTERAQRMGHLNNRDAAVVAKLLAQPAISNPIAGEQHYVF